MSGERPQQPATIADLPAVPIKELDPELSVDRAAELVQPPEPTEES